MDFYREAFDIDSDSEKFELTADNWYIEIAITELLWTTWGTFIEFFYVGMYLENPIKKYSEEEVKKFLTKSFWDGIHSHLLSDKYLGDETEQQIFDDALNNNENSEEVRDFFLAHVIDIINKYSCDAYLAYCEDANSHKFMYYLGKAQYFTGLLIATHAGKKTGKEELKNKMIELANIRHEKNRIKDAQIEKEIKKIWLSSNWSSYTECTDYIHQNTLIPESNYRKIYSLVYKVAKEKK